MSGQERPTKGAENTEKLLVFNDAHKALVDLGELHDPDAFWHSAEDALPARCVWDSFLTNIVARAQPSRLSGSVEVPYDDLSRKTTVREILETPGVGAHDPSRLSAIIEAMIEKQPDGEPLENGLLTDGRGNLFPCRGVLVLISWYNVDSRWHAIAWDPDVEVSDGRRVFSGNLKFKLRT